MVYAETSFDKAVDDALEEMSRKEAIKAQAEETRKSIETTAEKPRNPFASEDLANAIKKATEDISKSFDKVGKDFSKWKPTPFVFDDMHTEYGGRMKLNYLNGCGAWNDVMSVLIAHGYEVTAYTEVASEVEREVDGIDKWVVIEFDEVE